MKYLDVDKTAIARTARKAYKCRGDGSGQEFRKFASTCPRTIAPGSRYVEYVGDSAPFQSGTRHCYDCYRAFFK